MNIYMTGASGTGKTSLAKELCVRLGMNEAPSVARTSPYKMGSQIFQDYVMHCVDYQCLTAKQSVVTRTPIDVLAYSMVHKLAQIAPFNAAERFISTKPILLYLPKYWEPEDDGFRPTDNQDNVDEYISTFIQLVGPDDWDGLHVVGEESIEQRADNVVYWLKERGYLQ